MVNNEKKLNNKLSYDSKDKELCLRNKWFLLVFPSICHSMLASHVEIAITSSR